MKKMILFELLLLLGSCATRIPLKQKNDFGTPKNCVFLGTGEVNKGNTRIAVIIFRDTLTRSILINKLYKYK